MQVTIARQLGLDPSTVSNFFMNARRRSVDKWKDDKADLSFDFDDDMGEEPRDPSPEPPMTPMGSSGASQQASRYYQDHIGSVIKASTPNHNAVLVTSANPAAVVQHLQQPQDTMTPTAALDLWPQKWPQKVLCNYKIRKWRENDEQKTGAFQKKTI